MIRRIFVPLTGGGGDPAALAVAFAAAARLGAHVDAALLRFDQRYTRPKLSEPLPPGLFEEIASLLGDHDAEEDAAEGRFEEARNAAAAPLCDEAPGPGGLSARWLGVRPAERIVRDGRLSDLIVLGPTLSHDSQRPNVIRRAALATAGRPLLLASKPSRANIGSRVAIAWNGSASAAQAVSAAMPLLAKAAAVHVLTVPTERTRSSEGERLVDYLKWHGIAAEARVLENREPVGSMLLAMAGALDADLLVMGGYIHSRLQDLLLGGVTAHVFAHATLPIFIAR
ncbi:MAG TPA: universal stress protein [Stellaceae bacterium]|nr:universal stress protein [Stellaceae bacterium]